MIEHLKLFHSPARAEALQMLHFGAGWMDMMLWRIA